MLFLIPQMGVCADFSSFPKWQHVIKSQPLVQGAAQDIDLEALNKYYNHKIKYSAKRFNYWQTPRESLLRGKGHCADIAIAKYYDLAAKGVNPDNMLIVVGNYLGTEHATLQVKYGWNTYILDNNWDNIMEASIFYRMMKIDYSINHHTLKIGGA